MSARFSHAACNHPSTKVARAACRRKMAKLMEGIFEAVTVTEAGPMTPPAESEILRGWYEMKSGPLELTAAPVAVLTEVTRDNWREFKGQSVTATLTDERVIEGTVTGWSEKLVQIKGEKLIRVPVAEVESVTV